MQHASASDMEHLTGLMPTYVLWCLLRNAFPPLLNDELEWLNT